MLVMLNHTMYFLMSYERTPILYLYNLFKDELQKKHLRAFLQACCYCLGFKASSASHILEMLNDYNERLHPEFLLFVYANLF